jgi:late competence protein required for DNA uptake (superfamily II DNA/RNA helicase)
MNKPINKIKQNTIRKRANHTKLQEAIKNEETKKLNLVTQIHKEKLPTPILAGYNKLLEKEKFWIQSSSLGVKLSILKTNNDQNKKQYLICK